jgi:cysteine desulfurase
MRRRIYLDHAATSPILPEAAAAMVEACESWANPGSPHAEGRAARARMEEARRRIATAFSWEGDLVFVSGATEAIAIVLARARAERILVSAIEHPAVLRAAPEARRIAVGRNGLVDLDDLDRALSGPGGTPLVAVQSANNETGAIQPLAEIGARLRAAGGLLLADCAQSAGKLALPEADFAIVAAHKIGGPPGIGALLVRDLGTLEATGGQERGYRAGTPALPAIMAFAAAAEADRGWYREAERLRSRLDSAIVAGGGEIAAGAAPRIATVAAYRLPGMTGIAQMMALDLAGIAVSTGSACSSGSLSANPVLLAMGWSEKEAGETIRISLGRGTSEADVDAAILAWQALGARSRAA